MSDRRRIYLGLGSNIDPERHLKGAISRLREAFGPLVVSRVCRTPAVGFEGAAFCNLIVGIDTDRGLESVVRILHDIEEAEGRQRGAAKFAARTLDIDVLTFGDHVQAARPAIPRPDILEYAFVLGPLADIAPDDRHPVLGTTYGDLWAGFRGSRDGFEWLEHFWETDGT